MADHHHHHHHRPHRLSVPPRATTTTFSSTTPRPLYPPVTPTPTPSKNRLSSLSKSPSKNHNTSLSFLFLLLFSLRSFYSLFPFLRSSPSSFSIFPFSFLVSLLSLLLTLSFSLLLPSSRVPISSLSSISPSQHRLLIAKSLLLAFVFLLRFQALRYCGAAAMILAELSGNVAARFVAQKRGPNRDRFGFGSNPNKVRGFFALFTGLFLLSISWDRIECFKLGLLIHPSRICIRAWPMLLPFLSGFLGCYERVSMNWIAIRELGRKRVRLYSLFFTTALLFVPAVVSMFMFEAEGDSISIAGLGWPLANTVVFGVLLSENYDDEKLVSFRDSRREFLVTFVCTVVLELFYFPELSLWGLLICGLLIGIGIRELDPVFKNNLELGFDSSELSFTTSIMNPIRHILSERKSRKIALFLLINAGYMVVEFVVGFMSNSLGLISDACHMLFDCAALAIGLYASYISRLPANGQFNYGRGRFEVLSGYVNAVFLVLVGALIVLESFERILDPQEISTGSLLTVSIGGLAVNVVGLIFFHEEHHHAHGGAGSCSHSHSHDHGGHNHKAQDKTHECVLISTEGGEKSHSPDNDHEHHKCNHNHKAHHHDHHHEHDHDHHHDHHHEHDHDHHHHHEHDHDHDHHHHAVEDSQSHENCGSKQGKSLSENPEAKKHRHHQHIDHNMEGIFLHVLADTLGSVGVVISTLLIQYKGWVIADPACSIFISVLIVSSVIPLLRNSAQILLQRVPRAHEQYVKEALSGVMKMKGVIGIQNLHVWSLTNSDIVGTLHLHVSSDTDRSSTKGQVSHILRDAGIEDLTVQVECVKSNTMK